MGLEMEHECPECGETQSFWKTASTKVHLGRKAKWECTECGFGFVEINDAVDTSTA